MEPFYKTANSPSKFLIHPSTKVQLQKPSNIFKLTPYNQQPKQWFHQTMYSVCGDSQFKQKFVKDKSKTIDISTAKKTLQNSSYMFSTSKDNFNMSKTIDKDIVINKLRLDQKLRQTRDKRSFQSFKDRLRKWTNVDQNLRKITKKQSTVMSDSFQKVYAIQNPQKLDLINDNIPQFWKHSLRSNNKRLKSHVKNHQFSEFLGQQMLQTLKRAKIIQSSIPKLPIQHLGKKPNKIYVSGRHSYFMNTIKSSKTNDSILRSNTMILPLSSRKNKEKSQDFQEVFKINYSPQNKWMALQNIF